MTRPGPPRLVVDNDATGRADVARIYALLGDAIIAQEHLGKANDRSVKANLALFTALVAILPAPGDDEPKGGGR